MHTGDSGVPAGSPGGAGAHLEAGVGDEPGVVTQVGCVVLHHPLGLRLAQVLVGGGEAACRQHHCGALCKHQNTSSVSMMSCWLRMQHRM